jgi:hypothetical protein
MSWISENYEKATLGTAAVVAAGLGFFGWQNLKSVEIDFIDVAKGAGPNDPAVKKADKVVIAKKSFELNRAWIKPEPEGRPVDLFTGIPLFVNKNDVDNPVDLPVSDPVHPPIPNQWWIDYRIDPGFGDSPQRDEDEDGFTNMEEFLAKTDPTDVRSYPPLIAKLTYVGNESIEWVLRPKFPSEDGGFTFEYSDTAGKRNRTGAANSIAKGGLLFVDDPAKERFKYLGFEKVMEMNEKIKAEIEVTIVEVEDQRPNKIGQIYKIPAQFRAADVRKFSKFDRTAVLSLEALNIAGQEFKVEELTEFALPPGAKEKRFKITEVTEDFITVVETLVDGQTRSAEISKGKTGPAAP